ncbi:protein LURP-one-related 11 [Setaria italica]|nr:protein LURP-one-related 11 [Setaria italica]
MAITRVQPLSAHLLKPCATPADPAEKQVYTVWMKSLVFNGHGCTIYGQDGRVAYRVDNYACSRSREVYVMDSDGKTLLKLLKKNFGVFKTWKGYSYRINGPEGLEQENSKPWFSVQKAHQILKKGGQCSRKAVATVCISGNVCKIDGVLCKSEYRISDANGEVVAEMKRKQTASGVVLGEDVLSLTVSPAADRLLVVGLVVVCGLLSRCI